MRYKAALVGITIFVNEESCTSKASFLYLDDIPVYHLRVKHTFSDRRIKGAWYKAKDGRLIHADVNVRYNIIIRKVVQDAPAQGDRGRCSKFNQGNTASK